MKLVAFLVCVLACSLAYAQNTGRRSILPDGTSVERKSFVSEKRIEERFFDEKDNLTKIAIHNTDANGITLKSAVYDPKGKLRYWKRFVYAENGRTVLETRVYNPSGEIIMKTTFEKGKPKVVDGSGRPLSEAEWKSML